MFSPYFMFIHPFENHSKQENPSFFFFIFFFFHKVFFPRSKKNSFSKLFLAVRMLFFFFSLSLQILLYLVKRGYEKWKKKASIDKIQEVLLVNNSCIFLMSWLNSFVLFVLIFLSLLMLFSLFPLWFLKALYSNNVRFCLEQTY